MSNQANDKPNNSNSTVILENINTMSNEMENMKKTCEKLRKYLDEGAYKIDSVLNVINNVKNKEQNIMAAGVGTDEMKQMNEEQVDNLLEMLKTPAFQSVAKQLLTKWVNMGKADNNESNANK